MAFNSAAGLSPAKSFLLGVRHFRDGFEYPGESGVALEPPYTASCHAGVQPTAGCRLWLAIVSFCEAHGAAIEQCLRKLYTKKTHHVYYCPLRIQEVR